MVEVDETKRPYHVGPVNCRESNVGLPMIGVLSKEIGIKGNWAGL